MKRIFQKSILKVTALLVLTTALTVATSCEDMLSVDSMRYVSVDDNTLATAGDSVWSVLGVMRQLQNVAQRYLVTGEVRADLLDINQYTVAAVRELSDYTISPENPYADPSDYYAIINNCNYFISRTAGENHPLVRDNALMHAFRAWTYMQVAFNWGKVYYFTEPLLSVNDVQKEYQNPVYDIPQLLDALIADLEPLAEAPMPNYGTIYSFSSKQLFFPIKVLLGDLYLWRGASTADYERAATCYADYIDRNMTTVDVNWILTWTLDDFLIGNFDKNTYPSNGGWASSTIARNSNNELVSAIQMATSVSEGLTSTISSISVVMQYQMSQAAIDLFLSQEFMLHYVPTDGSAAVDYYENTRGDLRGGANGNIAGTLTITGNKLLGEEDVTVDILHKLYYADHFVIYRLSQLLLRYAEAVNRAGKPLTAFAVLKYGLKPTTFIDTQVYPTRDEWESTPYISVFNKQKYEQNTIGIHARGCGSAKYNPNYDIGVQASKEDSIRRVEDLIFTELALETSFEGNRMQDLIRFALRRNDNDFIASRVAAKHVADGNAGRIYNLLLDRKNWFLPEPVKK